MFGAHVYTPEIWPLLATAGLVVALGLYSWPRRAMPGVRYFVVACSFWTLLLVGGIAEIAAVDPAAQIAWHTFQLLWQLPVITAVTCFSLDYVQPGRWLTRRRLLLLAAPPLFFALLILTNEAHHIYWQGFVWTNGVRALPASAGWVTVGYALLLASVQVVALLWLFIHSSPHRWPVALMLAALVLTRGRLLMEPLAPHWVMMPAGATVMTLFPPIAYVVTLFGFKIFDPMPAAQQAVLAQMAAGVVVFDLHWRVFNLNPAAEAMFGRRRAAARGQNWAQLAPGAPPLPDLTQQPRAGLDFTFARDSMYRYTAVLSPLHDFRRLHIGYLLLLSDVTEAHQAQAQIVEQQRTLAALDEREHLARELHDTIGQVLGYASLQVAAISQLLEDGRLVPATAQLARLTDVLQEAHADVRQQILNLRATPAPHQPFFTAVQHYLEGYTANYAIGAQLAVDAALTAETLPPETQTQLFRILQEALSNARKHGRAQRVQVTFTAEANVLRMCITDDGCGFVLDGASTDASHLGLRFMRERALEVGGRLSVASTPGAGACVAVEIPQKEP